MTQSVEHPEPGITASPQSALPRRWEVDTLRGVAVILMMLFHLTWDLQYIGLVPVNVYTVPWQIFARSVGSMFLFLLGVSLVLRATRQSPSPNQRPDRQFWQDSLRRGGVLFGLGMVITLATYWIIGEAYVRFGVLHLLGLVLILATPFVYVRPWVSLVVGALMLEVGFYLTQYAVTFPWLIWLGVQQFGVPMVDYYPLLPWGGMALLGVAAGKALYADGTRPVPLPDLSMLPPIRGLRLLGRHSLLIYMLHQPVLFGIVTLLGMLTGSN